METGVVVRFDEERGYGFIEPDAGGEDVFIHASALDEEIKPLLHTGRRVRFDSVGGHRGRKAFDVQVSAESARSEPSVPDSPRTAAEEDCDTAARLSEDELSRQITELLLAEAPDLTGAQVAVVRGAVGRFAEQHGWTR
ncbi:cold-shock protein [Streptomonospora algeriensis]|uniref:Cold-shock protein n=1 Tax=Streptomonospora algeriensis TaxID=995084 RepID=A0ABW3BAY1_9ACTN